MLESSFPLANRKHFCNPCMSNSVFFRACVLPLASYLVHRRLQTLLFFCAVPYERVFVFHLFVFVPRTLGPSCDLPPLTGFQRWVIVRATAIPKCLNNAPSPGAGQLPSSFRLTCTASWPRRREDVSFCDNMAISQTCSLSREARAPRRTIGKGPFGQW